MVEVMTSGEILEVKHSSKAKDGPWNGRWAGEMAKKTLVKRASKSWPQSNGRDRIDKAISVLNEHEGLSIPESSTVSEYLKHSPEQHAEYHERLQGDALDFFLWWNPLDDRIKTSLINSFTEGKGKGRDLTNKLDATGREMFLDLLADLTRACEKEDGVGVAEVLESLTVPQREALLDRLNMELVLFARGVVDGLTEDDARQ